jgi:hypothetical protein
MQATAPFKVRKLPRPGNSISERRNKRSNATGEALQFALDRAVGRGELDAVIISDATGMVVAKSDTDLDLNMLAAILPLVGRGQVTAAIKRGGESRDLTVRPVEVQDEMLYVAALGGVHGGRLREVASSVAAAKRILAA